jgi:SAM-dependent methyltransferase
VATRERTPGYDPGFFERLAALEADSWWFRSRNRLIGSAARRWFPGTESVLEVGCGTGFALQALDGAFPEARLVGGELHPQGLEFARRRVPRAEFVTLDARAMELVDEFDLVAAFDVLEHIEDDLAALRGMARAVRRGGGLMLTVPQHPWLWSHVDVRAGHARRYTRRELVGRLSVAGFRPFAVTSFVSALVPLMAASRLRGRLGGQLDPLSELRLPRALDRTLEVIAVGEQRIIRAGVSLPVGGSLLVGAVRDEPRNGRLGTTEKSTAARSRRRRHGAGA